MIKVDLSNAFSPRIFVYLVSLIPGLFFETSVALGSPETANRLIYTTRQAFPLPSYALLALFIASSFVIGHFFMQLAWFVELLLGAAYSVWRFGIRNTFGSHAFYKLLARIQRPGQKRGAFVRLFSRAVFAARMPRRYDDARPVMKCLGFASKELLKKRYGINVFDSLSPMGEEWHVWNSVLGKPLKQITESITVMRTSLGCGLAGLLSLPFAPPLRAWYYVLFCAVFSATGLYMTWNQFRWRTDPVRLNHLRLQSVMLELADAEAAIGTRLDKPE